MNQVLPQSLPQYFSYLIVVITPISFVLYLNTWSTDADIDTTHDLLISVQAATSSMLPLQMYFVIMIMLICSYRMAQAIEIEVNLGKN